MQYPSILTMMMRLIPLVLLFSLFTGCCCTKKAKRSARPIERFSQRLPEEERIITLAYLVATEMKYHHKLRFEDASIVYNEDGLRKVNLRFSSQNIVDLCPARAILVDLVETFLEKINSDRDLEHVINPSPFTVDQLTIDICFQSYYGRYVDPYYIGWVRLLDGISYFYAFETMELDRDLWHSRNEYYYKTALFVEAEKEGERAYRKGLSGPSLPPAHEPTSAVDALFTPGR